MEVLVRKEAMHKILRSDGLPRVGVQKRGEDYPRTRRKETL